MLHSVTQFRFLTLLHLTKNYYVLTDSWATAPGSFLFSLRNNDDLPPFQSPLKNENVLSAIRRRNSYGPTFGSPRDLSILPRNGKSEAHFGSNYKLPSGYTYSNSKTQFLIAGSKNFIPAEVEVLNLM